ncbi:hypothetical protein [Nocardioides marmoraquaticus]
MSGTSNDEPTDGPVTTSEPPAAQDEAPEPTETGAVGDVVPVNDLCKVTRPDGSHHTVSGDGYVLDVPGVHVVDGVAIEVG